MDPVAAWKQVNLDKKKFYQLNIEERRSLLGEVTNLSTEDMTAWSHEGGLSLEAADYMIENVVGLYSLPVGIAQNFVINGKPVFVPMVVEEPSIVAGVSFMAKLAQVSGGFHTSSSAAEMIGQIQLLDLTDLPLARKTILEHRDELLASLSGLHPSTERLGGGAKDLEVRIIENSPIGGFLAVQLIYDVRDVMGANAVNTAAEQLAASLEALTGGRAHLRILSNLADRRLAKAEVTISSETLAFEGYGGAQVRDGIIEAWAFAAADP
ncbi:MAG: 3-hydroxy-3-methylglutaryl-CoA reductase, partial [Anaerolineaceae bacterium]